MILATEWPCGQICAMPSRARGRPWRTATRKNVMPVSLNSDMDNADYESNIALEFTLDEALSK